MWKCSGRVKCAKDNGKCNDGGRGLWTMGFPAPDQPARCSKGVPTSPQLPPAPPCSTCLPICYYLLMFAVTEKCPFALLSHCSYLSSGSCFSPNESVAFPTFGHFSYWSLHIPFIVRQGGCYKCGEGCQRCELAFTNVSPSSMLKCPMSKRSISESNLHPQMFQSHPAFTLQYNQSIWAPFFPVTYIVVLQLSISL